MGVTVRFNLLCCCALALALGGCQKSPGTSVSAANPPPELRRGLGAEPETLDPQLATDNAALAVVADLYEGLAVEAPDGSIVPGAAERWERTEDGEAWTFVLRPGLRWSDGRPLDAEHFAAGLRAAIAPGSTLPNAGLFAAVRDVEVLGPDRLRIRLSQPLPYLPSLLALPIAAPLVTASGAQRPGNGPFRLVRWRRGEHIDLERNPHYRDASSVPVERVRYRIVPDLTTELNLYRTGELDVTSEVPNSQVAWLHEHLPGELKVAPYLSTYAYAVNLARVPDREARTALAMAVDRDRITTLVTGAGEAPAFAWVPPGLPGYAPAAFEWRDWPGGRREQDARRLWQSASSRQRAPAVLTLCTDASANHHRTAIALADQWHETLGLAVRIVELEWSVYLATREAPGDCDLLRFGWSADFADAEAFAALFVTGHPMNTLGYSNPDYDDLVRRSRAASGPVERNRMLAEAERVLLADAPVIPVFHRVAKRLVKPQVRGYQPNPLGHLASRQLSLAR